MFYISLTSTDDIMLSFVQDKAFVNLETTGSDTAEGVRVSGNENTNPHHPYMQKNCRIII